MAEPSNPSTVVLELGDLYEDCQYEPLTCTRIGDDGDELTGISLINGRVGSCSVQHCGVRPLTLAEAVEIRGTRPPQHVVDFATAREQQLHLASGRGAGSQARAGEDGIEPNALAEILSALRRP